MPQLDPTVFAPQLFWLALTFIPLYLILWKVALPRVTEVRENRRGRIGADLEKAEALKVEAEAALADYQRTIAEATAKAQASIREAAREMSEDAERQRNVLAGKLNEQLIAAEGRIAEEKQRAIDDIGAISVDLARTAANRLVDIDISEDEAGAAVAAVMRDAG